jgi:DNA-binding PadR family transcriptional regulator
MSVRHSLLAILAQGSCYGHQLRQEFERRTGGTWSINAGQVYQTLDRLERDKLIERSGEDAEGRELYVITDAGRAEADAWLTTPVIRSERDELAIKLALALTLPGTDATAIIGAQRHTSTAALALVRSATPDDLGEAVVIAALVQTAEADLRWLDAVERLVGSAEPYGLTESPRRGRPAKPRPDDTPQ